MFKTNAELAHRSAREVDAGIVGPSMTLMIDGTIDRLYSIIVSSSATCKKYGKLLGREINR
ncbi:MAG: hypothetical protein QXS70_06565 [Desulfurococcaceae archaeon]